MLNKVSNFVAGAFGAIFFTAAPVLAHACVALPNSIPQLEDAKAAFGDGDYGAPLDFIARLAILPEEIDDFRQQLSTTYPNGFEVCETIVSKEVSSKFREEITIFADRGEELLYLYWQVAKFRGDWIVINFRITQNFTEISNI